MAINWGSIGNFVGGIAKGARNAGVNLLNDVSNIQTPIRSGGTNSPRVTLGDIGRNIEPAVVSAVSPVVKESTDLVGGLASHLPVVGDTIRHRVNETDQGILDAVQQAHRQLGVNDKNLAVQTANFIPKMIKEGAYMEAGGKLAEGVAGLAGRFAGAGLSARAMGLLNQIHDTNPAMAQTLAKYALNPAQDVNLFKAVINPKAAGSAVRLARAAGSAIGGSAGYNMSKGLAEGKSPGKTALNTVEGIPGGVGIEFGNQALHSTLPKVQAFLQEATSSATPAVRATMSKLASHLPAVEVKANYDPKQSIQELEQQLASHPAAPPLFLDRLRTEAREKGIDTSSPSYADALAQIKDHLDHQQGAADTMARPGDVSLTQNEKNANGQLKEKQAASEAAHPQPESVGSLLKDRQAPPQPVSLASNPEHVIPNETAAKETGSAHANQGGSDATRVKLQAALDKATATKPPIIKEGPAEPASASEPTRVHRQSGPNGTKLISGVTGEVHGEMHTGSPGDNLIRELLREDNSAAYGKNGGDVAAVHKGQEAAVKSRVEEFINHVTSTFTPDEQQQMRRYAEGAIKPTQVSDKVRQVGDQWKEIERIGGLVNKEANRRAGIIDETNGVSHVEHIPLDRKPAPGEKPPAGSAKYSTQNSTQKGAVVIKLMRGGKTKYGDPAAMGMERTGSNTYRDKFGNEWHPARSTIDELNDHGFHYETDVAKIMASSFNKYAKTANNLKLGRNLTAKGLHGDNVIPRMQGEVTPPKGYHESHIPGLENHWIRNGYHKFLYTASDNPHGLGYKALKLTGKVLGLPSRAINQTFFAENSLYHQLVNEAAQGVVTAGAGVGKKTVGLALKGALGGDLKRTAAGLSEATTGVLRHNEAWYDAVRAGVNMSEHSSGGIEKSVEGLFARAKALGHAINLPGKLAAKHIGDTIRLAKFSELTAQGMSHREAAAVVNKLQGDYSRLSDKEQIVRDFVQFYPFFKHQLTGLAATTAGAVKNPAVYAGSAVSAAALYAVYSGVNQALKGVTGNQYAEVKKGGMLGLIDDAAKAPGQVAGFTDKAGVKHPGVVPSIVANRLNPAERQAIEQTTGKSLTTNTPFDTSAKGRTAQAAKAITQVQQAEDTSTGKKSLAEEFLNTQGMKLPHGMQTPAAPNLRGTAAGDLINVSGHDAEHTLGLGAEAKALGGSKLAAYQYARLNGDHSFDKFFAKNPELDPLSQKFQGFGKSSGSAGGKTEKLGKNIKGASKTTGKRVSLGSVSGGSRGRTAKVAHAKMPKIAPVSLTGHKSGTKGGKLPSLKLKKTSGTISFKGSSKSGGARRAHTTKTVKLVK